jgi:hypothetical protein
MAACPELEQSAESVNSEIDMQGGNVKVSFTLLNCIHNSRLSKNPPFPPFEKGGNRKSPFVKGDLEGFSSAQHDFDETLLICMVAAQPRVCVYKQWIESVPLVIFAEEARKHGDT